MPSRDWFTYTAEFIPLPASSSATVIVPILADSDFELTALVGDVRALTTDESPIAGPAIRVLITDQGVGRSLMDVAQEWTNVVGTAQRPFLLPMPRTFRASSTIAVALTNDNAAARQVRLAFVGYKKFP